MLQWLKNRPKWAKLLIFLSFSGLLFIGYKQFFTPRSGQVTYETATAERGTLINSISGSGTITSGNYTNVSTKTSGVVTKVYVTNGDTVSKGQKIAEVELDESAKARQSSAWVAYLNAKEAYLQAINSKAQSDISMWQARQDVLDAQEAYDDMEDNDTNPATHAVYTDGERMIIIKTLDQTRKAFSVAEAQYLNSDADISNSSAQVAAALRDYQENSGTILAPTAGLITDLGLAEGLLVSASTTTSTTSGATIVSTQTVAKVKSTSGRLIATISLTEVDIINVKANQKVTLTLDAYPDSTFTGQVLAVNTSGQVNSGVTNYPVTILLDPVSIEIYPNMAVNVEIITGIKTDVILVPSSSVQSDGDSDSVQIMIDGKMSVVQVQTGSSNGTQTEIVSGVAEGDVVVTSTITSSNQTTGTGVTSPFSGIGQSTNSRSGSSTTRGSGTFIMGGPGF